MVTQTDHELLLEDPLLQKEIGELYTGDGSVDLHGKPVRKNNTGNWRACLFILGLECCERIAYNGVALNLISYLTSKLHEDNVSAAKRVASWHGLCYLTPLIGAFVADSYLGRYWSLAFSTVIYFIGMCILALSASITFMNADCMGSLCPSASSAEFAFCLLALYIVSLGTGGTKPCVSPFGADQFDNTDPQERIKRASYFNWFVFIMNFGMFVASALLILVQENFGWGIGYGISALLMGLGVASFFSGTSVYRIHRAGGSTLTRVSQVVVASCTKWKMKVPDDITLLYETAGNHSVIKGSRKLEHTESLKWLDKAAVLSESETQNSGSYRPWKLCTVTQVEELKILIRMLQIWSTGIVFYAIYSQASTMFVLQGKVMDRKIGSFTIPAASLATFQSFSSLLWIPIYDQIVVPIAKKCSGKEKAISELQRMGIGILISVIALVAAAGVEITRLQLAKELGVVNENVAIPLTILWQIPQFFLIGVAQVFLCTGQIEFFYEQSPDGMRSLGTAFCLLTVSLGSFLDSFIITIVTAITTTEGKPGWIPDNLNQGHLDKFFWLIASIGSINLMLYVIYAKTYKQKKVT